MNSTAQMMTSRRRVWPSFTVTVVFLALWNTPSFATDVDATKQACVAAADRGQALRNGGQYLAARDEFARCSDERCPTLVREQCTAWLRQAVESTPTVVFAATDETGRDLAQVTVTAEGRPMADRLDGRPVELDPGRHELRFEAPDREAVVLDVVLRAGDRNRALRAVLPERHAGSGKREPPPWRPEPALPPGLAQAAPPATGRTIVSATLLAAAAASGAAGLILAIVSRSDADRVTTLRGNMGPSACFQSSSDACAALGDAVDAQRRDFMASSVCYAGAGVFGAAAVATWILWPQKADASAAGGSWRVRPTVGAGRAGVSAELVFQ